MFKAYRSKRFERSLFPPNMFDLLEKDDPVFLYVDIVESLDFSSINRKYSRLGEHAYDPMMLFLVLLYGYTHGVFSSRKLAGQCQRDLCYMYITGSLKPDFRTISDFRKNHIQELKGLFQQSVLLAKELSMVSLGHVSLDGSFFEANSSKHKAMSYGRMLEAEKALKEEIEGFLVKAEKTDNAEDLRYGKEKSGSEVPEELLRKKERLQNIKEAKRALEERESKENPGKEIDPKKQISFADKEAKIMGSKSKGFDYRYNGQACVDEESQIIVGGHLTKKVNDLQEVVPALKEMEETVGELPEKMTADAGYLSAGNIEELEKKGIDGYIATGKGESSGNESTEEIIPSGFTLDEGENRITCPVGKELKLYHESDDGAVKKYRALIDDCRNCSLSKTCRDNKFAKRIVVDKNKVYREQMRKKLKTPEGEAVYRKRKHIVEPVFGQIKYCMGFRSFQLRGFEKTKGEFYLVCMGHNIRKIVKKKIEEKKAA